MAELMIEKWSGTVNSINIGALKNEGGTRTKSVKVGGQKTLPYLYPEGDLPNKPVIAFEVWDSKPQDWPQELNEVYGAALKDPLSWAEKCVC